jgi:diguanylate cyclase (GGDEF)-like protein
MVRDKINRTKDQLLCDLIQMQKRIKELERNESALKIAHRSLTIANRHSYLSPMLSEFISEIKEITSCKFAGIRILDQESGIPYHSYSGLGLEICDMESAKLRSRLCICNQIMERKINPEFPFFTQRGAFFTNCETADTAALSRKYKNRTVKLCKRFQYNSICAVPIHVDNQKIGLLYAADDRESVLTGEMLELLETLSSEAGTAIHRVRLNEQSQYMATHDELTGLPNRIFFNYDLTLALIHSFLHQSKVAVVMLDLDHFKEVNDTLGHAVGDKLLKMAGERIQHMLRKGDTVARMGGDEFMLALGSLSQDDAVKVVTKILKALQQPFDIDQHVLHIGASIGIAFYPNHGEDASTLIKNADAAMYVAKQSGRNQYCIYST